MHLYIDMSAPFDDPPDVGSIRCIFHSYRHWDHDHGVKCIPDGREIFRGSKNHPLGGAGLYNGISLCCTMYSSAWMVRSAAPPAV